MEVDTYLEFQKINAKLDAIYETLTQEEKEGLAEEVTADDKPEGRPEAPSNDLELPPLPPRFTRERT